MSAAVAVVTASALLRECGGCARADASTETGSEDGDDDGDDRDCDAEDSADGQCCDSADDQHSGGREHGRTGHFVGESERLLAPQGILGADTGPAVAREFADQSGDSNSTDGDSEHE